VTRGFRKAYVPRNYRREHFVPEELPEIRRNLPCKVRPVVEHREQDALDIDGMAERLSYAVNRIHEF